MTQPDRSRLTKGGQRTGAGRHKKEPTKVIRVPVRLVPLIKELCKTNALK